MTHLLTTTVLVLGLSGCASMATAGPNHHTADTNNDGKLSYAEFSLKRSQGFETADTNSDGYLSKAERKAQRQLRRSMRAEKREGKMAAHTDKHFNSVDTNGDGSISRAEHAAGLTKKREKMKARKAKRKARKHAMKGKRGADTNKDGIIDRAEFDAKTHKIFARMDTDNNGFITAEERKSAKHHKMKKGGHGH